MSFKNFLTCCFPSRGPKEHVIKIEEDNLTLKYSTEEKKVSIGGTENKNEVEATTQNANTIQNANSADDSVNLCNSTSGQILNKLQKKVDFGTISVVKSANTKKEEQKKNDESAIDLINSTREISEMDINVAPILILEDEEGSLLGNRKLTINAAGLINGSRNVKDGFAFFAKKSSVENFKSDYELNIEEANYQYPYVFVIFYKKETNSFFIRSYREKQTTGIGILYIKLGTNTEFYLKKSEILSLGNDFFFFVNPTQDGKLEIHNLGSQNDKNADNKNVVKYSFDSKTNKLVTVGRDSSCSIPFPRDRSFSRVHTSFIYDTNNNLWKIRDGAYDKSSTNGTWIYATHSYEINDNMTVKIESSKFKIALHKNI